MYEKYKSITDIVYGFRVCGLTERNPQSQGCVAIREPKESFKEKIALKDTFFYILRLSLFLDAVCNRKS